LTGGGCLVGVFFGGALAAATETIEGFSWFTCTNWMSYFY
jgi:hypothetical protein